MVPDSIVLTFDVRLPPTTDLDKWELMLLVTNMMMVMSGMMMMMMTPEHRDGWRRQARESLSPGCKR